jgi:hypothetical protein
MVAALILDQLDFGSIGWCIGRGNPVVAMLVLAQLELSIELMVKPLLATDLLAEVIVPAVLFVIFTFNFVPMTPTRFWTD